jgi:hypothetical protein
MRDLSVVFFPSLLQLDRSKFWTSSRFQLDGGMRFQGLGCTVESARIVCRQGGTSLFAWNGDGSAPWSTATPPCLDPITRPDHSHRDMTWNHSIWIDLSPLRQISAPKTRDVTLRRKKT